LGDEGSGKKFNGNKFFFQYLTQGVLPGVLHLAGVGYKTAPILTFSVKYQYHPHT
jgi:hypothetical protein